MHLSHVQVVLWLAPTVLESVIVLGMAIQRLWRTLPIFMSYLVFEIGRTVFLLIERQDLITYFYAYWVTEALGSLAALCVIKELFDAAFERRLGLRRLGNLLFQWSTAVLVISAVLVAWASPGGDSQKLMAGILTLKRTVTFVEAGLLGFLFLFALTFGLSWHHYAVGISVGLGLYGSVELVAITARAIYGPVATRAFNWAILAVNNCCVCIWATYFLIPHHAPEITNVPDPESYVEKLNEALLVVLKR
jgi:hypothetical protein